MKINYRNLSFLLLLVFLPTSAQDIENREDLKPFTDKLNENKVSQILFIGDSHIQADWLTAYLRKKFQDKYGNAGRGLVFPYHVANTNGSDDFFSVSNKTWETFRLVHNQKLFPQIGASGFVIGNNEDSFLEINFKNAEDNFDKVIIYNDDRMDGEYFSVFSENQSIRNFIDKKVVKLNHTATAGETFHEIVSKYNSTTTRLKLLNGNKILNPEEGNIFKVEKTYFTYNPDFEKNIDLLNRQKFTGFRTDVIFTKPHHLFLMKTNASNGNVFYGFQFLKNVEKGVVLNTVGVNGATYHDFLKFPLQIQQLVTLKADLLIIALGTNEAFGTVGKEEFQKNIAEMIIRFRNGNTQLPVLLIAPPDNLPKQKRVAEIVSWLKESAEINNAAFFNLYEASGGKGYFKKAQLNKEASADGVHFMKPGYEYQAELIWKAFSKLTY